MEVDFPIGRRRNSFFQRSPLPSSSSYNDDVDDDGFMGWGCDRSDSTYEKGDDGGGESRRRTSLGSNGGSSVGALSVEFPNHDRLTSTMMAALCGGGGRGPTPDAVVDDSAATRSPVNDVAVLMRLGSNSSSIGGTGGGGGGGTMRTSDEKKRRILLRRLSSSSCGGGVNVSGGKGGGGGGGDARERPVVASNDGSESGQLLVCDRYVPSRSRSESSSSFLSDGSQFVVERRAASERRLGDQIEAQKRKWHRTHHQRSVNDGVVARDDMDEDKDDVNLDGEHLGRGGDWSVSSPSPSNVVPIGKENNIDAHHVGGIRRLVENGGNVEKDKQRQHRPPQPLTPMVRRPSLARSLDETSKALPILGWDTEDTSSGGSLASSKSSPSNRDRPSSFIVPTHRPSPGEDEDDQRRGRIRSESMIDPYDRVGNGMMFEDFVSRRDSLEYYNGRSLSKFDHDDNEKDDVNFLRFSSPSTREYPNGNNAVIGGVGVVDNHHPPYSSRDVLKLMMMEEEYDPRKPWRKGPPGGAMGGGGVGTGGCGVGSGGGLPGKDDMSADRRHSSFTMRSSFASSVGDIFSSNVAEMTTYAAARATTANAISAKTTKTNTTTMLFDAGDALRDATSTTGGFADDLVGGDDVSADASLGGAKRTTGVDADPNTMVALIILGGASVGGDGAAGERGGGRSTYCNDPGHASSMSIVASALTEDDDDGSELTELRLAHEALFPVPESVSVSGSATGKSDSVEGSEKTEEMSMPPESFSPRASSTSLRVSIRRHSLSSFDIVQEEIDPRDHSSYVFEKDGGDDEQVDEDYEKDDVDYRLESVRLLSSDELEDLPTSVRNDPYKKRPGGLLGKDDDSVSYSDIDADPAVPPPSIKMCMTVRNSVIEREFATEQMEDIEYGETKGHQGRLTLQNLLEGGNLDNSVNSLVNMALHNEFSDERSSSKKSSKTTGFNNSSHRLKENFKKHTPKLDVKVTKNLRRKNKRLWKFCVWNCRKITMVLLLGLVLLVGFGLLTWWGVSKVAIANSVDVDNVDNVDKVYSSTPTAAAFFGGMTEGGPTHHIPSSFPTLRGKSSASPATYSSTASLPIIFINNSTENGTNSSALVNSYPSFMASKSPSPTFLGSNQNHSVGTPESFQPSVTAMPSSNFLLNSSSQSPSPSSNSTYNSSSYPSSSPSRNDTVGTPQSLHPSVTAVPSSSSLLNSSSQSSVYPISSPSPSRNSTYNSSSYPSSSPSRNDTVGTPQSLHPSVTAVPSLSLLLNSSSQSSLYPVSSPSLSSNSTYNSSSYPSSSPSNNASLFMVYRRRTGSPVASSLRSSSN